MPPIAVPGASLFTSERGQGAQTVCMSHGLLWSHKMFEPQLQALSDTYRCIAWDHRGQGQSSPAPGWRVGVEECAGDAIALLEQLAGAPVHLVGHSVGAQVAMLVAARRPELVRSLVVMDATPDAEPLLALPQQAMLSLITLTLGVNRALAKQVLPIVLGDTTRSRPEACEKYLDMLVENRRSIVKSVIGMALRPDLSAELSRIRCPTLVMWGAEERAVPRPAARKCAELIPGARWVEIPSAGHMTTLENPEAVNAELRAFLSSASPT
ncbi:alpha/beta fold hydrolase [Hyalangium versicolor]|uniref:alpha/beta fold hydrolase n=1 Tax=Hyalangium versicolor TaxID=2861190 RepID=UPI001CCD621A|nr:alpha/beta hydrolase [Hyalangium versicolor]